MNKGIFITGTDTGVGKTYVACGIAAELRLQGISVGVMKPAETGCRRRQGMLVPADALALAKAAGADDPIDLINPYRFVEPLAPAVAAERAGTAISLAVVLKAYRKLALRHPFMIVEGAGGIMVPLTARKTFLDLAERLALPVLIVARPGLGTINHTLLTVEALLRRSIPVAGICINDGAGHRSGIAERTNPAVIAQMTPVSLFPLVRHGETNFADLASRLA